MQHWTWSLWVGRILAAQSTNSTVNTPRRWCIAAGTASYIFSNKSSSAKLAFPGLFSEVAALKGFALGQTKLFVSSEMMYSIFFFFSSFMKKKSNWTRGKPTNTRRIWFDTCQFFCLQIFCFRSQREQYLHIFNPNQKSSLRNWWQSAHCIGVNLNYTHFNLSNYVLWA